MAEAVSLELLGVRINEVLEAQRYAAATLHDMDNRLKGIEARLIEVDTDLRSLARVMLRLESRVYALEEASAGP